MRNEQNKVRFGNNNLAVRQDGIQRGISTDTDSLRNSHRFSNFKTSSKLTNVLGSSHPHTLLHEHTQFSNIFSPSNTHSDISAEAFENIFRNTGSKVSNLVRDGNKDDSLEEQVKKAMFNVLNDLPELGAAFDGFKFDSGDNVAIKQIKAGRFPEEQIIHATIEHDPHAHGHLPLGKPLIHNVPHQGHIHSHKRILEDHHHFHHRNNHPVDEHTLHGHHDSHHLEEHHLHEPHSHSPEKPVPTVTIVELPAEHGCRSFSTKHKVPIVVPKKVPYEECRDVPSVDCFFVLKTVDDIECSPKSYEDCVDNAIEVPYLDEEEQCEDIEYDDCVDVEEQVPIQVCKVVDPERKPIINREIDGTSRRKGGIRTGTVKKPVRGGRL